MKLTAFSVSMCVYGKDNPEHFRTAVESILNQTVKPDEVVLVVDGPVPDKLESIISGYERCETFKVIRLKENQGHGNARRISFENCRHELIALMDADDISVPDRFEKQLAVFQNNPEISIIGGNINEFIGEPDNIIAKRIVPSENSAIKEYMKKRCPFNQVTVMLRKSDVQMAGGYLDWYCEEDYYLWLRLHLAGAIFCNINSVLVNVRVGKDMYRRRGGWKYFVSEAKLQKYMKDKDIIQFPLFCINVMKRLAVQVLLPNKIRGWAFRKFAREKT